MAQNKNKKAVKKGADFSNERYYSKLKVYRKRQIPLALFVIGNIIAFTLIINNEMTSSRPWYIFAFPLVTFCCCYIVYPPTEEWEYTHWQNTSEKREQLFYN
ncbi:MAG: hypothetical protein HQK54_16080 [Oligoflexales bacterium]|nr:hypothetical protein [Oligoflexales bacterium]